MLKYLLIYDGVYIYINIDIIDRLWHRAAALAAKKRPSARKWVTWSGWWLMADGYGAFHGAMGVPTEKSSKLWHPSYVWPWMTMTSYRNLWLLWRTHPFFFADHFSDQTWKSLDKNMCNVCMPWNILAVSKWTETIPQLPHKQRKC